MIKYKQLILSLFFLYILIGCFLSIFNGISHDQYHEQLNWEKNFQAIKGFFFGLDNYNILNDYIDKYHGIAFHYLSQPFQFLFSNFVSNLNNTNEIGGIYISRHIPNFIIFSISGIYFFLICFKISSNNIFSLLSTILYLTYPYLFGHAQINAKDIPFLSFWIMCTYYIFIIVGKINHSVKILFKDILIISFVTAFLISIRISGSLIFLQYLIALIVITKIKKIKIYDLLTKNFSLILYFIFFTSFLIYLLSPIFWFNPLEIINSFDWMAKYYHDTCTLTLGECMRAQNLPSSYIFIWLFFKLPILIIFGITIFPFIEKKILNNNSSSIYYLIILFTILTLILILILKDVALYDELRHIMFLLPLIFILSLYNIYMFHRKIFYVLSILTIIFFVFENFALKKYQYTWLNSLAKFTNIQKNFEVDYWGLSNKKLQEEVSVYSKKNNLSKNICVYGDLYANVFLEKLGHKCFGNYSQIDSISEKPFFVYQNVRNLKRSKPKDCKLIKVEKYNYTFSTKDIITGKLWYCE